MRLLTAFYALLAIAVLTLAWKLIEPRLNQQGTSVIYAMSADGKNGGKPATVKLPDNLTNKQYQLLSFAYDVARADGIKYPQYLQGVLMQETKAGGMHDFRVAGLKNAVNDRYFGVAQIKLAAAQEVMSKYPELWAYLEGKTNEELQAKLILDDSFNVRVASKYLLLMGINKDPTFAVTAYNVGKGGAAQIDPSSHDYTVKVKQHIAMMKVATR